MRNAIDDIANERQRQIEAEGWTPEHDDAHDDSELADAAACYAMMQRPGNPEVMQDIFNRLWPWNLDWWKPSDRRRDLVKAGALIVAEIERLDRAALPPAVGELREAAADAFGTLHYLYETSDDEHVVKAAKEARDKLDAALGKDKGSSHD